MGALLLKLYTSIEMASAKLSRLLLSIVRRIKLLLNANFCDNSLQFGLSVWLSGNALASINVVALRQTWLVPGWVTVCGRVNHLGM